MRLICESNDSQYALITIMISLIVLLKKLSFCYKFVFRCFESLLTIGEERGTAVCECRLVLTSPWGLAIFQSNGTLVTCENKKKYEREAW